jgi:hypothetical protein
VDDFRAAHWGIESRCGDPPEVRFFDLDASHPIFHAFFDITDISNIPNYYDQHRFNGGRPVFRDLREQRPASA